MFSNNKITEFIVTVISIGKIKYCPGTFGSLAAFPLAYIIMDFVITNQAVFTFDTLNLLESQLLTLFIIGLTCCKILFIAGVWFSSVYAKQVGRDDPKEVVIDELVGQLLVITLCFFSVAFIQHSKTTNFLSPKCIDIIFLFVMPFALFRIFDIFKPWPINWIDKNIKGGFGIMLDDILAAIFATVTHYTIVFLIINFVG